MPQYDAVVIGSGPNGLSAAIELARNGARVLVLEGHPQIGGGTRTANLTLPGFLHDTCSAVHPMGVLSPFWQRLPMQKHGLEWIYPEASVAHPLDNQAAVMLYRSVERTMEGLGVDAEAWQKLVNPFVSSGKTLLADSLGPFGWPKNPFIFARFGLKGMRSAEGLAEKYFQDPMAQALFAGCAGHSVLPLDKGFSAAVGLMFVITAHLVDWPVAKGGSAAITKALAAILGNWGGTIECDQWIKSWQQIPDAKVVLFDTDPVQMAQIAGEQLPSRYRKRLSRYNYGPGAFKVDWALDGPIPWEDRNCLLASTVHVGGSLYEIAESEKAAWEGRISEKPYLILCQQSQFDAMRSPKGQHTAYAYCHVPQGLDVDMTDFIERQIERFAPGFRDLILARHKTRPSEFESYNPNYVGGAITGGAADITQLFTRPVARLDPYSTPNKKIFICSAASPPGGGVHGMCGYHAARSALKRL
ncbi:MAG: NAD(P)/FAD-dependent oxidoreductase [Bacteroidota bacterium]